jgi:hypothetical protein
VTRLLKNLWFDAEVQDSNTLNQQFGNQQGLKIHDQVKGSNGVVGVIEADTSQYPFSRLEQTISSLGGGVYIAPDEKRARDAAPRLSGNSTR